MNDDIHPNSGSDNEVGAKGMHLRKVLEYWRTLLLTGGGEERGDKG